MIRPIKELIVVLPEKESDKTQGGIYIPEQSKEKKQKGTVVAVGGEVVEVKAGDKILFGKYTGSEVEDDEIKYLIFKEEDVLGIIESKGVSK